MPELLAGGLIALSVLVFLRGWSGASVLLGTAALFVRELALPYAGIRLAWALWRRDWREALGWTLGFGVYRALSAVAHRAGHQAMPPHPTWHTMSWIQFGGLRFVLATVRSNGWLAFLPWWDHSVRAGGHARSVHGAPPRSSSLSVVCYLIAFAIAGQPFNWTGMVCPGCCCP